MADEGRARLLADPLDDVVGAGHEVRLECDVPEERCGQGCPLRGLVHDGVPRGESRCDPPGGEHQRRVPRQPITAVTPDGFHVNRSRFPLNVASPAPCMSKSLSAKNRKFRATRGITEDRCERRSHPLSRVSTAESSSILASTPSAMRCRTAPILRQRAPPLHGCFASDADRRADRGGVAARDVCDDPLVDRRHVGEPVCRAEAFAANKVVGRDPDPFDHGALVRCLLRIVRVRTVWLAPWTCQSEGTKPRGRSDD